VDAGARPTSLLNENIIFPVELSRIVIEYVACDN
jgi:hypothetical protein